MGVQISMDDDLGSCVQVQHASSDVHRDAEFGDDVQGYFLFMHYMEQGTTRKKLRHDGELL